MESRKSSNTIENVKKGATYGGFFGLSLGMGAGSILGGNWLVSKSEAAVVAGVVGLIACGTAGAIVNTSIGFFRGNNKQQVCQPNIIPEKPRNSIENAKKGAIYSGLFGLGFGMGMGEANVEFWKMSGRNTRGLVTRYSAVGLVVSASAGALIGFFGAKDNQQICAPNIINDKCVEPLHTKQASFKN